MAEQRIGDFVSCRRCVESGRAGDCGVLDLIEPASIMDSLATTHAEVLQTVKVSLVDHTRLRDRAQYRDNQGRAVTSWPWNVDAGYKRQPSCSRSRRQEQHYSCANVLNKNVEQKVPPKYAN